MTTSPLVLTFAAALVCRHLHSSPEAVVSADGLPVGHATRPVWCLFSSQDQDFKPEHSQTLPSLVILPVTALLTYYNICNRFQKLLVSVYDQFYPLTTVILSHSRQITDSSGTI